MNLKNAESVNSPGFICFPGVKYCRRKLRVIRAVGKMTRFEAESASEIIDNTSVSFLTAVQKIANVKLQPGLVGNYLKYSS